MQIGYCFGCNKKRPVKKTGEYVYKGIVYDVVECQWCRATNTRKKNSKNKRKFIKISLSTLALIKPST